MFAGHGVYLEGGNPVLPANAIAERLRAGNFGPSPNDTAPPGFQLPPEIPPQMMAAALRSNLLPNVGGGAPPAPAPAAAPAAPQMSRAMAMRSLPAAEFARRFPDAAPGIPPEWEPQF